MPYTNYFLIYIFKQHLDQAFSLLKAIGVNHIFRAQHFYAFNRKFLSTN